MRCFFSIFLLLLTLSANAQNFTFSFWGSGQRVCLTDAQVDPDIPSATLHFRDAAQNTTQAFSVYRRNVNGDGADWALVASALPAGTTSWIDQNVNVGEVWEYQVKRPAASPLAFGYTTAAVNFDQSNYRGQMILLIAGNINAAMPLKIAQLKRDLTADGWFVNQLVVPGAYGWDSRDTVLTVKNLISGIYNNAPDNDKPKALFILGHVPLPRAGLGGQAPDDHAQNAGARGADTFYADIDGVFTDTETYNPGGLATPLAINLPGDFKWDQDFIPSELEMAFGRLDFANLTSVAQSETFLTERYLDRLHKYRQVEAGWFMGSKSAFYFGFNNSNDGSYRSLLPISGYDSVYQNYTGNPHPQWVQNNGPFAVYMQNQLQPSVSEWNTYGMNSTVFSSDQSYWGFGDVPEGNQYSTIRALLALDTKCLTSIWTTMAVNIFHQSGMGAPLGQACKQIMDHNTVNQKLEKPVQAYDTPAFWNRTHFAFHGDPTLRLYQVYPPSNPIITSNGQSMLLSWNPSPDSRLQGYHIYKSSTESGIYQRITANPVTETEFSDPAYNTGDWYMVRAVILQKTGSGTFLNPSQGIFVQGTVSLLGQPGPVSGNTIVCSGSAQLYTVLPVPGATSYTWTIPVGWSGSSVTNQINIVAGSSSGTISVLANNANGSSLPSSLNVIVNLPPSGPGAISGNPQVCEEATQLYSVAPVNAADFYNWTLPSGWTGTSTLNTINVIAGSNGGTISVAAGNECGISAPAQLAVIVYALPAPAGLISGPIEVCTGSSVVYSVSPVGGALSYTWGLPEGATGQSNSATIEVFYGATAVSGSISVYGSNACGNGQAASMPVVVNPVLAQPGAINGALIVCEGSAQTYSITPQSGADFYNWILPPAWTGTSTSNTINVIAGSFGGTISVAAGNECGISAPSQLAVDVTQLPEPAGQINGPTEVCTESSAIYSVSLISGALNYSWILPDGATGQSSSNTIEVFFGANSVSGPISVSGANECGEGTAFSLPL
ncbi:MAG: fibronectin type III domain-containing protein, partial [Lentimicrobium sp.]|nr:fibronectin type III domain-containing protein [Lentimicrobium sp.]